MEDESQVVDPRSAYRRAKVEHYLRQAEEYLAMGRYLTAQKILETIRSIEPENEECSNLKGILSERLYVIQHRNNGVTASSEAEPKKHRPELVMIVDQDERVLTELCEGLRRYGFHTICAASYDEAIASLTTVSPDIIVSEVNFETGSRGFDLFFWVKTNETMRHVPFIFLAARIDREMLIAGKRFGVDDLIQKPADHDVVTASIVNSISLRKKTAPSGS
jgi:CheY-like chemotaxis protein